MTNNGLMYYLCDVNHNNIILMIKSKYGYEGYGLLMELLLKICRFEGYFCRWEEYDIMVFAAETGKDFELIKGISELALEKGFFDKGMYEKYRILTSEDLQQKFLKAVRRRSRLEIHEEYFLIELPDKFKKATKTKNVYNSEENVYNNEENVCNFSTSKVKSSQVKLSEVKSSQQNQSKVTAFGSDALPPDVGRRSCDDAVAGDDGDYKKTISPPKEQGFNRGNNAVRYFSDADSSVYKTMGLDWKREFMRFGERGYFGEVCRLPRVQQSSA